MQVKDEHIDTLTELLNIGVGMAAETLSEMVDSRVRLSVPSIKMVKGKEDIDAVLNRDELLGITSVGLQFSGAFSGSASLVFPPKAASSLVATLTGEEVGSPNIDDLRSGTLMEVGNIVVNAVIGSMGNMLQEQLQFSVPQYVEGDLVDLVGKQQADIMLWAATRFEVESLEIEGSVMIFFEFTSFDALVIELEKLNDRAC
ncbi:MAG: chemotaxis protein CheX [Mariprofundaceae bacterium]